MIASIAVAAVSQIGNYFVYVISGLCVNTTWQVRQIWNTADLKPHRLKTFKISNDPDFADKVVDIVGLYMNPPANSMVLCVDEKTQIQALDRRSTPKGKDLHVILDNHSAHKTAEIKDWLQNKPHIHFHFTPTRSSWLNAVEGWFAQLERRSLYRGVFSSVSELNDEIERYIEVHNGETIQVDQERQKHSGGG